MQSYILKGSRHERTFCGFGTQEREHPNFCVRSTLLRVTCLMDSTDKLTYGSATRIHTVRTSWCTDLLPEFTQYGQADVRIYCQNSYSTDKLMYGSTARIHTVWISWRTDLLPEFIQYGQTDVRIYCQNSYSMDKLTYGSTARIHTVRTS